MEWRIAEVTPPGGGLLTIVPAGSNWKYLDDGSDQGTAWREPTFEDESWPTGGTPAGYGGISGVDTFATTIDYGGINFDRHETTYFRRSINLDDPSVLEYVEFNLHLDDGAVIYVNGTEVIRDGFDPDTVIAYDVLSDDSGNEGIFDSFRISPSFFVAGENIIAVELHQDSRGSSDLVFNLEVTAKEPLVPTGETLQMEWDAVWESGEQNTFTTSQAIPSAPIRPGSTYRARVRHQDDTGRWSHWSEPLQLIASAPDTTSLKQSIVISEIMYHPADATPAEEALGFSDESFEFVEITNIGNATIDLSGLRFTKGVDFDFLEGALTDIAPGARVLVVNNQAAFESRNGAGHPIAGEWEIGDRLSNSGEQLKLSYGAGIPIRDFVYFDESPWSSAPDGNGFSLTLIDPNSNPDHGDPANWRPSVSQGGSPGDEDACSFASWAAGFGLTPDDPNLDIDKDGIGLFREYAQGGRPDAALPEEGLIHLKIEDLLIEQSPSPYVLLSVTRKLAADDLELRIESNSGSLSGPWENVTDEFVLHSHQPLAGGNALLQYRSPRRDDPQQYWRLRFITK
jgi:hypothetical protein